jgi:hypothetical protein
MKTGASRSTLAESLAIEVERGLVLLSSCVNVARDADYWNNEVEPLPPRQGARKDSQSFFAASFAQRQRRSNVQVVYRRCCGLDVHKASITACVLVIGEEGQREVRKQVFGTYWKELLRLKVWLLSSKVEHVAMESTGVYFALSSALFGRVQVPLALG